MKSAAALAVIGSLLVPVAAAQLDRDDGFGSFGDGLERDAERANRNIEALIRQSERFDDERDRIVEGEGSRIGEGVFDGRLSDVEEDVSEARAERERLDALRRAFRDAGPFGNVDLIQDAIAESRTFDREIRGLNDDLDRLADRRADLRDRLRDEDDRDRRASINDDIDQIDDAIRDVQDERDEVAERRDRFLDLDFGDRAVARRAPDVIRELEESDRRVERLDDRIARLEDRREEIRDRVRERDGDSTRLRDRLDENADDLRDLRDERSRVLREQRDLERFNDRAFDLASDGRSDRTDLLRGDLTRDELLDLLALRAFR